MTIFYLFIEVIALRPKKMAANTSVYVSVAVIFNSR